MKPCVHGLIGEVGRLIRRIAAKPRAPPACWIARSKLARAARNGLQTSHIFGTAEGWLYVVAVIDLFSRRVVGWSDECRDDRATGDRCAGDGDLAPWQARRAAAPFRSRQPIHDVSNFRSLCVRFIDILSI